LGREIIAESRYLELQEAIDVLGDMTLEQKRGLAIMMRDMANADGEIDPSEWEVIVNVFRGVGIVLV
jgi:uncharacterized tellurite resistance protein B-like protein